MNNYTPIIIVILIHSVSLLDIKLPLKPNIPEEGRLEFCGLANKYGFKCMDYEIVTEDGYILTLFRIPGNTNKSVFLMHGLLETSDDFFLRGNTSLGVILAKAGYDVWAGNTRGNRYTRRHIKLDPDLNKKCFWDFSIDEHALIDLPTMLDFALETTYQEKISYVGISQGTTIMYALAAAKPEYNQKINVFVSFASVCYLQYLKPPLLQLAFAGPAIIDRLKLLGVEEFVGFYSPLKKALDVFCTQGKTGYDLCVKAILFAIAGSDEEELELEFLPTIVGHFPAGTSLKNLLHYSQLAKSGRFQKFDYGVSINEILYMSATPPEYDIKKVTMNVAMFVGNNDRIAPIKMAETIKQHLPNVVRYTVMEPEKWNHFDFIIARNAYKYLYPDVLDVLKEFSN